MNINTKWYAHPNDVIGGWSVMNCDKPPSRIDLNLSDREVATFVDEDDARHMVQLHNRWLHINDTKLDGGYWEDCQSGNGSAC